MMNPTHSPSTGRNVPTKCLGVFAMPTWVTEQDVRNVFEPYGTIDRLNLVINRETGRCRGSGFVYYSSVEEAKRARLALRDGTIDGIPFFVDFFVDRRN